MQLLDLQASIDVSLDNLDKAIRVQPLLTLCLPGIGLRAFTSGILVTSDPCSLDDALRMLSPPYLADTLSLAFCREWLFFPVASSLGSEMLDAFCDGCLIFFWWMAGLGAGAATCQDLQGCGRPSEPGQLFSPQGQSVLCMEGFLPNTALLT